MHPRRQPESTAALQPTSGARPRAKLLSAMSPEKLRSLADAGDGEILAVYDDLAAAFGLPAGASVTVFARRKFVVCAAMLLRKERAKVWGVLGGLQHEILAQHASGADPEDVILGVLGALQHEILAQHSTDGA